MARVMSTADFIDQVTVISEADMDATRDVVNPAVSTQTGNYTVLASDGMIVINIAADATFTLPAATAFRGLIMFRRIDAAVTKVATIAAAGSDTINGLASLTLGIHSSLVLICDGVSAWRTVAETSSAYVTAAASYTVLARDRAVVVNVSADATLTLPTAASHNGILMLRRIDATTAVVTVSPNGADTIDGLASTTLGQNSMIVMVTDGAGVWRTVAENNYGIVAKTTAYTILPRDAFVVITLSNNQTFTLPSAANYRGILVIRRTDSSATSTCTIARAGSDTINGATSTTIAINSSLMLFSDGGTAWRSI